MLASHGQVDSLDPGVGQDDMVHVKVAAGLSPQANEAIRLSRRAGPRVFLPPDTDIIAQDALARAGLTRTFMGHVVLTAAGCAVLRAITGQ